MTSNSFRQIAWCAVLVASVATSVSAGGPLLVFDPATQQPYFYPTAVDMYTDNDPFFSLTGPVSGEVASARVADGIAQWSNVPTATFSGSVAGDFASIGLPDINVGNVGLVIGRFNGGGYHVIYDNDGSIVAALAGPGVLGFSTPEFAVDGTPELTESYVVLNGAEVSPGDTEALDYQAVFTHEFGHGINLAHTQSNGAVFLFGDDEGPGGCPRPYSGLPERDDVETMYPFINPVPGGTGRTQGTVDLTDDVSALSDIYPAPGWPEDFATISGTVFRSDEVTPVTGVNVIARNIADPWHDCSSMLSGAFTQGRAGPDGRYVLNGLTPGADYALYIDAIVVGGFSTPPARPLPGPEEFWNGVGEGSDPLADRICEYVPISPMAGAPFQADMILNFGVFLGDDDFASARLPFPFEFCGFNWTVVFIGSNGFLTFGQGDTDFSDSVSDLVDGPPRIAAWWADLNPSQGGAITIDQDPGSWTVNYTAIPEFLGTGSNTFSVTLRADGTVQVDYGDMTVADGLVGRSEGFGVPDPGPTDLSAAMQPLGGEEGTVYEQFHGDNDLPGLGLEYDGCTPYVFVFDPGRPGTCYASTGNADMAGALLTVDPATGAGTLIGQTGRSQLPALAINSRRELWGSTGGGASQLVRISASDAATQVIATIRNVSNSALLTFVDALAFDANDVLYGVDASNTLWTIDTGTARATAVGSTGIIGPPFIVGLAFDPTSNRLYGSSGGQGGADAVYELDPVTGAATLVGHTGLGNGAIPDVTFVGSGELFGSKKSGNAFQWIHIDKGTGTGTVVGDIGFASVSGLAWSVYDTITVAIDIKPGFCPNTFNLNSFDRGRSHDNGHGRRLPVVVVGTNEFDAAEIDPASLRLEGVAAIDTKIRDITGPSGRDGDNDDDNDRHDDDGDRHDNDDDGWSGHNRHHTEHHRRGGDDDDDSGWHHGDGSDGVCGCPPTGHGDERFGRDGIQDLLAFFRAEDVAAAIDPGEAGEERQLMLTGFLRSGQPFEASDCIVFIGGRRARGRTGDDTTAHPPQEPSLGSAFPNPFNPVTRFSYEITATTQVTISVFDVQGRLIERLVSGVKPAGRHFVEWDASHLASGIYFYRMVAGDFRDTRKLILLK